MKRFLRLIAAILISILICIPAAFSVFYYMRPMENVSYNLSILPEDDQDWEERHGWILFTDMAGEMKELTPDGTGGYLGLTYPGQTFYYSRTLTEELDSPTLRIDTANRTVSVFLDGEMVYTDCPNLDNRIGSLTLPMLEYDRTEPVIISLPPNFLGKTLTIAQSSPVLSEKQSDENVVYPCDITLFCGYSYESELIASTTTTILPATLLFALGLFMLAAFIWNAAAGILSLRLPVFVLAVFLQMCSVLCKAEFFYQYFGSMDIDPISLFFYLSVAVLLLFLTFYAKGLRPLFITATVIQWFSSILYCVSMLCVISPKYSDLYMFFMILPQITGFITLTAALVGSLLLCIQGSRFFRCLTLTALTLITGYGLFLVVSIIVFPDYVKKVFTMVKGDIIICLPNFSLQLLWQLCLISCIFTVVMEIAEREAKRRTEYAVLHMKNNLAIESYENLRLQSEEVKMLRHDMTKHYSMLRSMVEEAPERLSSYLDDLIGQAQSVRPVVFSRNQTLNILLNGKLNAAAARGIFVEIVRSDSPEKLPFTDTELCCLVINILDNAINAASLTKQGRPYIKLDFHCKNQHFIFSCENSMPDGLCNQKKPTPEHGYGLKIIRQIMSKWGDNMLSIKQSETTYTITIVIPL